MTACGLCRHAMTMERCGSSSVPGPDGPISLCHHDSHDCYRAWTVYGERPDQPAVTADVLRRAIADRLGFTRDEEWPPDAEMIRMLEAEARAADATEDDRKVECPACDQWSDYDPGGEAKLFAHWGRVHAPPEVLIEFADDIERRLPLLHEPDPVSDWSQGVAWAVRRARNMARDRRRDPFLVNSDYLPHIPGV